MRFSELGFNDIDNAISALIMDECLENLLDLSWKTCQGYASAMKSIDAISDVDFGDISGDITRWNATPFARYIEREISDYWWRRDYRTTITAENFFQHTISFYWLSPVFDKEKAAEILEPTLDSLYEGVPPEYLTLPSLLPTKSPIPERQDDWTSSLEGFYLVEDGCCWYDAIEELKGILIEAQGDDTWSRDEFISHGIDEVVDAAKSICKSFLCRSLGKLDLSDVLYEAIDDVTTLLKDDPDIFEEGGYLKEW